MPRSGEQVFFLEPHRTEILWEDLDYHLPRIRRYNSGTEWTLLDHLVLCGYLLEVQWSLKTFRPGIKARVVSHDLHEVNVGDMTNGLKKHCPDYKRIETIWEEYFQDWLGLGRPNDYELAAIKDIDRRAVMLEAWLHATPIYTFMLGKGIAPLHSEEMKLILEVASLSIEEKLSYVRKTVTEYQKSI